MSDDDSPFRHLEKLSVLIVDDNQNMRRLLHTLLRAVRITAIRDCATGVEALAMLTDQRPDVIITDLAMKPINGLDFVRMLRTDQRSPAPNVPVIMLTGHSEEAIIRKAREAGVDDFVVKPVSAKMLAERITRVVGAERTHPAGASPAPAPG